MVYPHWHDSKPDYREFIFVFGGIAIFVFFRLVLALQGFIHPDEAYYWAWSLQPDWAYYDQGPGIAWYISLFTHFLGDNYLALKLAALFAFVPVLLSVYFTARELGLGPLRSSLAVIGLSLCPGVFVGSTLVVHDTPLLIFWSLALFCMVRFLRQRSWLYFYLVFLFMGLGALCKFSMGGFALGLVFWLIFQKTEFYLLKSKQLWMACLITLICLLPIFYWNYQHNWDQIGAIVNLRSSGGTFAQGNSDEMIIGQLGMVSPFWFLAFCGILIMLFWQTIRKFSFVRWRPDTRQTDNLYFFSSIGKKIHENIIQYFSNASWSYSHADQNRAERTIQRHSAFWMLIWNSLVLFVFFGILSRGRNVQANWLIPAYPAMFILLAAYFPDGRAMHSVVRPLFKKLYVFFLVMGLLVAISMNVFTFYAHQIFGSNIDSDLLIQYKTMGYKEMIDQIDLVRQLKDPTAQLVANRYQDAAIAQWYLPGHEFVSSMNIAQKNQYSYWPSLNKGSNYFIFMSIENPHFDLDPGLALWLQLMFSELKEYPPKTIYYNGVPVKKYKLWYAKNFKVQWYEIMQVYMDRIAIFDLMPSMRGYDKGLAAKSGNDSINKFIMMQKLKQKCPKEGAIDRLKAALFYTAKKNCEE